MNVDFVSHFFSQDVLELYALGLLSVNGSADVEEHLLVCPQCQTQLAAADTYIGVVRSACILISSNSNSFPKARPMQVAESL